MIRKSIYIKAGNNFEINNLKFFYIELKNCFLKDV